MNILERLKTNTGEEDERILLDCIESAKNAIMNRRYPFQEWPDELERRYLDLQYRIAVEIYNKRGAEGEVSHSENGISRTYGSPYVSEQLLSEVTPYCGVI